MEPSTQPEFFKTPLDQATKILDSLFPEKPHEHHTNPILKQEIEEQPHVLFPNPESRKSYVFKFLKPGPQNAYFTNPQKFKDLKFYLKFTVENSQGLHCLACSKKILKEPQIFYEHLQGKSHVENVHDLVEKDQEFEDFRDQLSDLNLATEKITVKSKKKVLCYACEIELKNENSFLWKHIKSSSHKSKVENSNGAPENLFMEITKMIENTWFYVERFWCQICHKKFKCEVEFSNHLLSPEHVCREEKCIQLRKTLVFGNCRPCGGFWFGFSDTWEKHRQIDIHEYLLLRNYQDSPEPIRISQVLENVQENLEKLVEIAGEAEVFFLEKKKEIFGDLEKVLRVNFPKVELFWGGSTVSGLCTRDSEMDVFFTTGIISDKSHTQKQTKHFEISRYFSLLKHIFHNKENWEIKNVIVKKRTSVIRLYHINSEITCNLAFGSKIDADKAEIIKLYTDAYPQCKNLILLLRKWFFLCELFHSKNITTFTISWLVIFYFQILLKIPTVAYLNEIKLNFNSLLKDWKMTALEKMKIHGRKWNYLSTKEFLIGFFDFYSTFDYQRHVICPYLGTAVEKVIFIIPENVPRGICYKNPEWIHLNVNSPMCMRDPMEDDSNVTENVSKLSVKWFRDYCDKSATILRVQK